MLLRQVVNRQIGVWSNNVSLQVFMNANATTADQRGSPVVQTRAADYEL